MSGQLSRKEKRTRSSWRRDTASYDLILVGTGPASAFFLLRYLEASRVGDGVWAGVWLACCALSKQNFGALAGLAILIGFLWGRRDSPLAGRSALSGLARSFSVLALCRIS